MNFIAAGKKVGYTPQQVRAVIEEVKHHSKKTSLENEVLSCENLEDIKILLLSWIEQGNIST